ncbi:hypothetical protein [Citrobacter freundii]|uniref:hypothetical protein n=3 Tax=Pseudomonadota TaxID=1224 RepID=UPI00350F391C
MSESTINFIGVLAVIALAWYFQIYRPRQQLQSPGEIKILPVLGSKDRELVKAINAVFPAPYIAKNNVYLSELLYPVNLQKNPLARKKLQGYKIDWLILNEDSMPFIALTYPSNSDELMLDWLAQAGIGCLVIDSAQTQEQLEETLLKARDE